MELDTTLTPELKAEGATREFIRAVQQGRKESGCRLDDRIKITAPNWPAGYEALIKAETLATEINQSGKEISVEILPVNG